MGDALQLILTGVAFCIFVWLAAKWRLLSTLLLLAMPVALGVAMGYGLVGIQILALAYLLLFVRGRVFPAQFLSPQDSKNLYYLLLLVLSATMWTAVVVHNEVFGTESLLIGPLQSDPALVRWYWSALVAFLLAFELTAFILILDGLMLRKTYLADYYEGASDYPLWPTLWAMISIRLGINSTVALVEDGQSRVLRAPGGRWVQFAGPGLLIVSDGNAVVMQWGGKISRIVGAGITLTKPYERPGLVVPLRTESVIRPIKNVVTRDGVIIEEFNLFVYYQVDPDGTRPVKGSEFAYNEDNVKKIWRLVGKDWGKIKPVMETIADTSLRDVIARHDLDEVFTAKAMGLLPKSASLEPRQLIKGEVCAQINKTSLDFMGVKVVGADIGEVKIPEEATDRLLHKWMVDWDRRIDTTKAETEKLVQVTKATAQMETIQAIAQGLKQLVGEEPKPRDWIALRFIEFLEQRAETATATGEDEIGTLVKLQSLEALGNLKLLGRAGGDTRGEDSK